MFMLQTQNTYCTYITHILLYVHTYMHHVKSSSLHTYVYCINIQPPLKPYQQLWFWKRRLNCTVHTFTRVYFNVSQSSVHIVYFEQFFRALQKASRYPTLKVFVKEKNKLDINYYVFSKFPKRKTPSSKNWKPCCKYKIECRCACCLGSNPKLSNKPLWGNHLATKLDNQCSGISQILLVWVWTCLILHNFRIQEFIYTFDPISI